MLIEHIKELYGRIEQLENQINGDDGGGRRRRWRNNEGDAREDKIEGVKLNINWTLKLKRSNLQITKVNKKTRIEITFIETKFIFKSF